MFPLILSSGDTFLIEEMFLNHWHFREFFNLSFAEITAEGAVLSIGTATTALSDDDDREDLKAYHVLKWQPMLGQQSFINISFRHYTKQIE